MSRRLKPAVELASDIGAKTLDLYEGYDTKTVEEAFRYLATVNPQIFYWLEVRLRAALRMDTDTGEHCAPNGKPIDGYPKQSA